ncbi:hypothetical protein BAKON_592 [Buchnera aphidicola str. Ak (Acyrthosiphon kondoi)]|uniref:Uncharacterized protein n=1 Tax=Buchnera aphidicola str. Ak (Acyrthosiphon kondoi) TaxID=1005090 RepID=G2LM66_9GAMM|nr:hypothetical protein BAKON_592 [Buchnera aphidicola str. Ak (Acyrthosiphon kondoi)]
MPEQSHLNFLDDKTTFSNKKYLDFNIFKIAEDILDTITNTVTTTYETVKTETINIFNGTTFKRIFFSSNDDDVKSDSSTSSITTLSEYIEQLKRTIESSKVYIRAIIEKIRYQGKIKIISKLNGNPLHPEYQSSFPDLLAITPKIHNEDDFYPFKKFDENFDLEGRKSILKMDSNFRKRMNKNIQESYSNDFKSDGTWTVADQLNSFHNIRSTIEQFEKNYQSLKSSNNLDKTFMADFNPFLFIINNNLITINDRNKMLEEFKKIIPNIESQKLISTYANQKFLQQSYLQLVSEHPEINQYNMKHSRNIYKIDFLDDGSIKLIATNLSDLDINNNNYIQKYKSFGIRATIILPPDNLPIMKYSYFLK